MKLKGDKELTAEELYNSLDSELYEILNTSKSNIDKIDAEENENFTSEINQKSKEIQICYRLTEVIYNMDLSVEESKAMITLSENNKLLKQLYKTLLNQLEKVNIYNDKELENFIRTAISIFVLNHKIN